MHHRSPMLSHAAPFSELKQSNQCKSIEYTLVSLKIYIFKALPSNFFNIFKIQYTYNSLKGAIGKKSGFLSLKNPLFLFLIELLMWY